MQSNTLRSVTLALLMIASVMVPLADINIEPPEMMDEKIALEAPPSPCLGTDACRGTDAGNTYATSIDLTSDYDWTGVNETNTYYGNMAATGYSSTSDLNNDFFTIDLPAGYGVEAKMTWNGTGQGFYDNYAYRVAMGPTSALGYYYYYASTYGGAYGYCWNSASYELTMNTEVGNAASGQSCQFSSYTGYANDWDTPMDLAGDSIMVIASCYYCYIFATNLDYQLDITVFPADAGQAGDATQDVLDIILDMPDSPGSWNSQTDTFTLDGTDTVNVDITSCDSWCP
jgi:hypothetical protein